MNTKAEWLGFRQMEATYRWSEFKKRKNWKTQVSWPSAAIVGVLTHSLPVLPPVLIYSYTSDMDSYIDLPASQYCFVWLLPQYLMYLTLSTVWYRASPVGTVLYWRYCKGKDRSRVRTKTVNTPYVPSRVVRDESLMSDLLPSARIEGPVYR